VILGLLASGTALAQRRGFGRMGGANLLRRPEVQTELKITDEQKPKIETMLEQLREERQGLFQDLRDASAEERQKIMDKMYADESKRVNAILNPDQQKRFRQISLQQEGPTAAARADVADELKLTDEQKKKVRELLVAQQEKQRELREAAGGDFQAIREKMEALRKETNDKVTALLTDEQKNKWKEMVGTPFTLAPAA
jgi:Spy/CpxP family protein refolding chaperone